ncbi:MAG: bicyclomycin resistance protein [Paucibacter sp.]|nr:bicyclomycin resistance protein [Roseateles sp.]
MKRRELLAASALGLALRPDASQAAEAGAELKTLRYAFRVAETGFDPIKVTDLYSRIIISHILEGLYSYDHLARPVRMRPLTADGMPEVSQDFKTWTLRVKPGIFFADDAAFKGSKRELTAADYVYSWKRIADPANGAASWAELESLGVLGLKEYRDALRKSGKPFDYDLPIEGLRALDRYTLRLSLAESRPRAIEILAQTDLYGAVAREVIEAYPGRSMDHPVGTGPFMVKEWRRSSLIVLEKNPTHRERYYRDEVQPAADDSEGQALLARFKDRRLPMIDRVEVAIIEEEQPRWLSFLNGEFNFIERVAPTYIGVAMPKGHVAPNLAKKGIQGYRRLASDVYFSVFNMEDPVVGGYTPDKVALRRAIGLATDVRGEIRLARRGEAIPAQQPYMPDTYGYDAGLESEMGEQDPGRAKALLDLYGYIDRDGDGWREMPDGSPLVLESLTTPDGFQREIDQIWQKGLAAVGLRVQYKVGKWPDNLKTMRSGKFQIWSLGSSASVPDGQDTLGRFHTSRIGSYNYARFSLPVFDQLLERMSHLPNGPERLGLLAEASRLATAYMPYKYRGHRYITDMAMKEVLGFRRGAVWNNWWDYVDIVKEA